SSRVQCVYIATAWPDRTRCWPIGTDVQVATWGSSWIGVQSASKHGLGLLSVTGAKPSIESAEAIWLAASTTPAGFRAPVVPAVVARDVRYLGGRVFRVSDQQILYANAELADARAIPARGTLLLAQATRLRALRSAAPVEIAHAEEAAPGDPAASAAEPVH